MKNINEFLNKRRTASNFDIRLDNFVKQYLSYKTIHPQPLRILDIGCGHNAVLSEHCLISDQYYACDYFKNINKIVGDYKCINLNEDKLTDIYINQKFDVIFCGEVIEHLFSPDELLDEIKDIMHNESILILSTPNLGYYINRLLLLFGICPLFLENSSEMKLGRKFKFIGQFNKTEGHIKIFTFGALVDLF